MALVIVRFSFFSTVPPQFSHHKKALLIAFGVFAIAFAITYPQKLAKKRFERQQAIEQEFQWLLAELNERMHAIDQFFIQQDKLSLTCDADVLHTLRAAHFYIGNVAEFGMRAPDGKLVCTSWGKLEPAIEVIGNSPPDLARLRFFGPVHTRYIGEVALVIAKTRSDGSEINALLPQYILKNSLIELQRRVDYSAVVDANAGVPLSLAGKYTLPLGRQLFPLTERVVVHDARFDDLQNHYLVAAPIKTLPDLALVMSVSSAELYQDLYWLDKSYTAFYLFLFILTFLLRKGYERGYESQEAKLRKAIRGGEFVNHYQPIWNSQSKSVVGIETLVRWQHPVEGLLYPNRFILDIEKNKLNVSLSYAILDNLRKDMARYPAVFHQRKVNINISGEHLKSPSFIEKVIAIRDQGVNLVLEITETELVDIEDEQVTTAFNCLQQNYIPLALDDFGTGYAGLQYLQQLPLDILKIDKSFVRAIGTDSHHAKMLDAVIQMAQEMDLAIVAEGVETQAHADYLIAKQVINHQGWLYSKAKSAKILAQELSRAC